MWCRQQQRLNICLKSWTKSIGNSLWFIWEESLRLPNNLKRGIQNLFCVYSFMLIDIWLFLVLNTRKETIIKIDIWILLSVYNFHLLRKNVGLRIRSFTRWLIFHIFLPHLLDFQFLQRGYKVFWYWWF